MMRPITKYTHQIASADNLASRVREAFRLAEEEKPGAVHLELPEDIARAARAFALHLRGEGVDLGDDWLNNGPIQLADVLPDGWRHRLQVAFEGAAVTLTTLGRPDLLASKLFALCDRGTDLADCVALAPTSKELEQAEPWLVEQDANPLWPEHVRRTLRDLLTRLSDGV